MFWYNEGMKIQNKALRLIWKQIGESDEQYYQSATMPTGVELSLDHAYVNDDEPMHRLDIARPEGHQGKLPVVIQIHGGGWVYGHKDSYYRYHAMECAKYGYAVLTINYRLAFDHPFPSMIEDVFAVLHWLKANAEAEALDVDNVFILGDSAGAHITALTALIHQSKELQERYGVQAADIQIKALGLSCGVYDFDRLLNDPYDMPMRRTLLETIFDRKDFNEHPLYPYASVSMQLSVGLPPVYLVSSEADPLCPESKQLIQELDGSNAVFKARIFAKDHALPHVFNLKSIYPESRIVLDEMFAFFAQFRT